MPRRLAAALAVLACLLISFEARASDPLPVQFTGGFLPPTDYFKEGTAKISVAMVNYLRDVSKCYRRTASDAFRFQPDNLENCLSKASQRLSDSMTQAGLSRPSTWMVIAIVVCRPPGISSTDAISAPARMRLPTGTGDGKRTLPVP